MESTRQNTGIAASVGAAGAAGAAMLAGFTYVSIGQEQLSEYCLRSDIEYVDGLKADCYSREQLLAFGDRPVLGRNGEAIAMSLAHPSDDTEGLSVARNCAAYTGMADKGYYAMSSREMRRERYFERACGTLKALANARKPKVSYFDNETLTKSDVVRFADGRPFVFSESAITEPVDTEIEKSEDGAWQLKSDGHTAILQEIIHADFNRDNNGDILVNVVLSVDDGTAQSGRIGFLEKTSPDAAPVFTPA